MSSTFTKIIETCIKNYEYEIAVSKSNDSKHPVKKPLLLEKVRKMKIQDGSNRCYSIHGPIDIPIPNHSVELYTLPILEEKDNMVIDDGKNSSLHEEAVTVILAAGNQPQLTIFDI